ncbi:large conductance mechanosensitive channel protein MscL [soil metagenome]
MISEFKTFVFRGNVVDLAVGVIIGAAFNTIVTSLIQNVITPLLLKPALDAANLTKLEDLTVLGSVKYGSFISAVLNFVIIAFVLFLIVKAANRASRKKEVEPAAPVLPPADILLLTEIRDLLKK